MKLQRRRGQSLYEYAILLAIVVAVLTGMQVYLKRGIQGMLKSGIDDFGIQKLPEEEEREYGDLHPLKGRLEEATSNKDADAIEGVQVLSGGGRRTDLEQTTTGDGSSTYRVGFEPESLVNEKK